MPFFSDYSKCKVIIKMDTITNSFSVDLSGCRYKGDSSFYLSLADRISFKKSEVYYIHLC